MQDCAVRLGSAYSLFTPELLTIGPSPGTRFIDQDVTHIAIVNPGRCEEALARPVNAKRLACQ
jgi:hypothetical protein